MTTAAAMAITSRSLLRPHITLFFPTSRSRSPLLTVTARRRPLSVSSALRQTAQTPNVIDVLQERGLLESTTSENLRSASCSSNSVLKVYCGFDPTSQSLHLGNLLGVIVLSWFHRFGHKVVALIGGATGMVGGDPSSGNARSLDRPNLDSDAIRRNCAGIRKNISEILLLQGKDGNFDDLHLDDGMMPVSTTTCAISPPAAALSDVNDDDDDMFVVLNNFDWWKKITVLDFLMEVGTFARVGAMIAKESVKKRLMSEEGLSHTEFTYQLLQGYDFLYMFKHMGVNVQIGGSDQWGNITAGTDLIRKVLQAEGAYGLTFPLLLKSDGTKFGKSENGAIWLSPSMLSPSKFYHYFFSVPDDDVIRFLKILTFMSMDEIQELEEEMKKPDYVPNTVQCVLAQEITRFVHGQSGLQEALKETTAMTDTSQALTSRIHSKPLSVSTTNKRPNVIDILQERGLLESTTSKNLRSACSNPSISPVKVYCGFDPTAESLHLGNLLGIIVLSWFQQCGHKVVALVGGATGRVGDPSGKSLERPELDSKTIERNCAGIRRIISGILDGADKKDGNLEVILDGGLNSIPTPASPGPPADDSFVVLNNFEWWKKMIMLDFLREVGRFARVGEMMENESVKKRLLSEEGISYTEFTYQLLQGYDFLYMFKNMGVNVQIGGSDQCGNIISGTNLVTKILQADGAYGLIFPLLLKGDGTKFGKSESGAIWLSPSMLSPYKFYQYFISVPDVDVIRFLKIFTFMSMHEIQELEKGMKRPDYVPNTVQRVLAKEITCFVHGQSGLEEALKATEALRPGAETELKWETIESIAKDVPSCSVSYDKVLHSCLVELSVSTGLFNSKSAARRLLKQGGLYLNNRRVDSEDKLIEAADIIDGKVLLLSAGKKNKLIIRIS